MLACIGSAVGMGNIWRFPYMVSDWGGMTFLIPYVLFVVLIGASGVIEEMALGRAAKGGPIKAFGRCTEIRTGNKKPGEIIGVIPVLGSLALAIGYTVVVGWIFKYVFLAISGGPGLMFIYMLNVFNGMPGGRVVEMVFYICVLFAGLSSLVNLYEAPVEMLEERFGLKRKMAVACMATIGGVAALLIQGIVSGWMDAVSIYICPLGAMLAAIMFFWVAGDDFALSAVNQGKERPIGTWFLPLGRFVLVPAAAIALIAGAILGGIG